MTAKDDTTQVKKQSFAGNGEKIGDSNSEFVLKDLKSELQPNTNTTRIQVILPSGARKVITIAARSTIIELYKIVEKE